MGFCFIVNNNKQRIPQNIWRKPSIDLTCLFIVIYYFNYLFKNKKHLRQNKGGHHGKTKKN